MSLGRWLTMAGLVVIAIASVSTAPWGAKLAHSMNVAGLKRAFAGLLLMLGTYMLYRSFSH